MYSKKQNLDKFYTKDSVALKCINQINLSEYDCIIEPSAGGGAFSRQIKHNNLIAMDLEPESNKILKQDWFDYNHTEQGKTLVIGNPPFGLRNKLSKDFIKKSIEFAYTIAMILPNVYNKHTNQNIFPKGWRLKEVLPLEDESFTVNGKPYHVPCSFFIFEKSEGINLMFDVSKYKECNDFSYCKKEDGDIYIMGAGCKVKLPSEVTKNNRGYYLKSNIPIKDLISKLNNTLWYGNSSANGGVWWLSKPELIKIYKEQYEETN